MFQATRMRRLRQNPTIRKMVQETRLAPSQLIAPFFVVHGTGVRRAISSMPGQFQLSVDQLLREVGRCQRIGITSVLLFGIPKKKDMSGKEAFAANGIIQVAIRAIKKKFPKMVVMADLCFCEYTSHGHCGVLKRSGKKSRDVDNDQTLKLMQKTAIAQAKAGVDFVAPSGMMDGAVSAIRTALDKAKFKQTGILAYSAKFSSSFYGPFREAAESAPQFGNRKTYQMNSANGREALREIQEDINEGADMVMVKPALSYLDVVSKIRSTTKIPVVVYNVSGEYSMVKAAERLNWLDDRKPSPTAMEILLSMKRAGADLIITYHAMEVAPYLK